MTQVRTPELATILAQPSRSVSTRVQDALSAAAATLSHASEDLIRSTTVVVDIGPDDVDALQRMCTALAEDYALDVVVRPHVGWCAVRFDREGRAPA